MVVRELTASVDLIDLRTIVRWDKDTVLKSVQKTGKCLIVHEDILIAGFGAEIAATIVQDAFTYLDAPVQRLAAPQVPMPYNTNLMDGVVPNVSGIRQHIAQLIAY